MKEWCLSTAIQLMLVAYGYCSTIYVNQNKGRDTKDCLKGQQSHPCATLDYALEGAWLSQNVQIHISSGAYTLSANNTATHITGKSSFSLRGKERSAVRITCDSYAGLSFTNSSNVAIYNVTFLSCGAKHVSSSNAMYLPNNNHTAYLKFLTGLYFLFCTNVLLKQVEISNSLGTGLTLYSTGGSNYIMECIFNNNTAYNHSLYNAGGGGVAIEFLFCKPGDTNCHENHSSIIDIKYQQNVSYVFVGCIFSNNNGSTNNFTHDTFTFPRANHNIALGRGGGLSVLFKGKSKANRVLVQNCTFKYNIAVWGGGMSIEFQDMANGNNVTLQGIIFTQNKCNYYPCTYQGTGGGGARIKFAGVSKQVVYNTVKVDDTIFSNNSAYFGGGISFFTFPDNLSSNSLLFNNIKWLHNTARLGSAIDLSLWPLATDRISVKPVFDGCVFINNTVYYHANVSGVPEGIGTVYTSSIPIAFNTSVNFTNNRGSALVSLDASVEFFSNTSGGFYDNIGRVGAAITLFNQAFIQVYEWSRFYFKYNKAELYGGGIYWESIGNRNLISSSNCFIRYQNIYVDPTDWKVSFYFSKNQAGISGNSIFATTLLGCLRGGNQYNKLNIDPRKDYQEVFCWKSNETIWSYEDENCSVSVATAAAYFTDGNNTQCGAEYNISVVPGKTSALPIYMVNDRFQSIPNQLLAFSIDPYLNISNTQYISCKGAQFYGDIGKVVKFYMDTIGSRTIVSHVSMSFAQCPPGFEFDSANRRCKSANYPFVDTNDDFEALIQSGYWMGYVDHNKTEIGVGSCFYCAFDKKFSKSKNYIILPENNKDLNDFFCKKLNRKGILCGSCRDGYAPAINSQEYKCIKCSSDHSKYYWMLYILTEYVPITVILFIVIIFNISITSGPANAFVFFAQIISCTTFIEGTKNIIAPYEDILEDVYLSVYGVWNLIFLNTITNDKWLYCLSPSLTSLHIQALHYLSAAYPLLLIVIVSIMLRLYNRNTTCIVCIFRPLHRASAKLLRRLNLNNSITDAFATFIVLSYVKFVVISSFILYPVPLHGTNRTYLVAYKYGDVHYASWQYAPYVITAGSVIVLCVLGPLLLILYSIKPYYSILEHYHLNFLLPSEKLNHFLTSFHHCYKDGSQAEHDRRYFAAVYFLLRLGLISTFAFCPSWTIQYVWQHIFCTIGLFLFGAFQPYKKYWYNVLDVSMFGLLSIINIISFYKSYLQVANFDLPPFYYWFQLVLIYLPLFYICIYISFHLITSHCDTLKKIRNKLKRKESQQDLEDFGEYMDLVTSVRLHQHNQYVPVTPKDVHAQDDEQDTQVGIQQQDSNIEILPQSSTEPLPPCRKWSIQKEYGTMEQ